MTRNDAHGGAAGDLPARLRRLKDDAERKFSRRRYRQCLRLYRKAIQADPDDARLLLRHGEACLRLRMRNEASSSFCAAALLLLRQGQGAQARVAARMAQTLTPQDEKVAACVMLVEETVARETPSRPPLRIVLEEDEVRPPRAPKAPTAWEMVRVGPGRWVEPRLVPPVDGSTDGDRTVIVLGPPPERWPAHPPRLKMVVPPATVELQSPEEFARLYT